MTVKYFAILTKQGAARLANATALGIKMNLTQMAIGDANGELYTPDTSQTALKNQLRIAPLNMLSIDPKNASQIIAEQIIPESEGGYWIREIGLYDDEGVLIAVANCPETYKPRMQEGSGRTQTIRMILVVSGTSAITLKIDPSVVLATRQYVDEQIIEITGYIDEQIAAVKDYALGKKFNGADIEDPELFIENLGLTRSTGAKFIGIEDTTVGEVLSQQDYIMIIFGQSNAQGGNNGGENPASDKVMVFDGADGTWGSSDYTKKPFSRSTPHGNGGNNNIALAFAHRLVDEHKARRVFIIYDAAGGRPIEDWMGDGVDSVRYASLKQKIEAAFATPEIIATGKTQIDFAIFAQGEANGLTDSVVSYRDKLAVLDKQFRAESWTSDTTPLFIMGMSGLHTRYQVWLAQIDYCENINRNCVYVNSAGLKTQYDVDGTGDYTHWLGVSLWEFGYYRLWQALHERGVTHRQHMPVLYARGGGAWSGQADAIAGCSSIVSIDSVTNEYPVNAPAATGSITWGKSCSADGNYTFAGGYEVATDNLANYSAGWGRELVFGQFANYCASFGYQNRLNEWGQFAGGRGHNLQHQYESAFGRYSRYETVQENPVLYQIGFGLSSGARRNALTVRSDGAVELFAGSKHDPVQQKEVVMEYVTDTKLKMKMMGQDGNVRSVTLTLA